MQFLAFSMVHWILVISHYTCIWLYMEMNASKLLNVAQGKIFCSKPSFKDKKMDEKADLVSYLQKIYKK